MKAYVIVRNGYYYNDSDDDEEIDCLFNYSVFGNVRLFETLDETKKVVEELNREYGEVGKIYIQEIEINTLNEVKPRLAWD